MWDGANITADITGAEKTFYARGTGLIFSERDGQKQYYAFNGHGDTVSVTDAQGNLLQGYDYDAFGNEKGTAQTISNPFRYCGEYYDEETGLIYLRNRYYAPESGRFTQEDPIYSGVNWYIYCLNNPIRLIGPFGLAPGDLQVNGHNIGYTSNWKSGTYGSVRDFVNAFSSGVIDTSSMTYKFRIGKIYFELNGNIDNGGYGEAEVRQDGKLIGKIRYTKVDDGTGRGYSKMLINLQDAVDIVVSKGYDVSLADELGSEGGTYTGWEVNCLVPTEKAAQIYSSESATSLIVNGLADNGFASIIANILENYNLNKQFQNNINSWPAFIDISTTYYMDASSETYTYTNNSNYLVLGSKNVGQFIVGKYIN